MPRRLTVAVERFPIAGAFTIARGSRTRNKAWRGVMPNADAASISPLGTANRPPRITSPT